MSIHPFVWVAAVIIVFVISFLTFWVLHKAYSKKWENEEVNRLN